MKKNIHFQGFSLFCSIFKESSIAHFKEKEPLGEVIFAIFYLWIVIPFAHFHIYI